jgi:hypothetical protein
MDELPGFQRQLGRGRGPKLLSLEGGHIEHRPRQGHLRQM